MPEVEIDEDIPVSGEEIDPQEFAKVSKGSVTPIHPNVFFPRLRQIAEEHSGLGFQVTATPTKLGYEQGLFPSVLVFRLNDWQEAHRIAQHLSVQASFLNKDTHRLIKIEPTQVGANNMGGISYVFDPSQYEPEQWGGAHPAGNFEAFISNTEIAQNSAGDGGNFICEFTTQAGTIKKYYPLWSRNEKAVRGAHNQLTALCYAIGYTGKLDMSNEGKAILNGKCKIQVGPQSANPEYMEIKKIFDMQGNVPGKGAAAPTAAAQPQGGGFGGAPQAAPQGGFGTGGGQPPTHAPGGFGGQPQQAPAGGQWGGQPQAPQQAPQGGQWGGQAPAQAPAQAGQWGAPQHAPEQPAQPQGGGWGAPQQAPAQDQGGGWNQGPAQSSGPGWSQ